MMTLKEKQIKRIIIRILNEEGYPTYANILNAFDLHTTADPNVVGYMNPGKGTITVNHNLDKDQVSVIIRHEILHEYLNHSARMLRKIGAKSDRLQDYIDKVDGLSIDDLKNTDYGAMSKQYGGTVRNIAGDLEISNLGYTEEDKDIVRHIKLNGQELSGLVTEDNHPEWVTYSFEELFDALKEEEEKIKQEMNQPDDSNDDGQGDDSGEKSDGQNGDTGNSGTQSENTGDDNDDDNDDGQNQSNDQGGDSGQNSQGNQQGDDQGQGNDQNDDSDTIIDYQSGGGKGNQQIQYVYGELIDDSTFVDENGNNW